jgi:photosystem II stability/assembly factor-like uncharacterized protein
MKELFSFPVPLTLIKSLISERVATSLKIKAGFGLCLLLLLTACSPEESTTTAQILQVSINNARETLSAPTTPSMPIAAPGTWQNISPPGVSTNFENPANNYGFQTIVLDPQSGAIYVGTCNQGLWKSGDQGKSWIKVNTGVRGSSLDSGRLWSVALDPVNPQIIYTTAGYGEGGILKSTNGGREWTDMIPEGSELVVAVHSRDIYSIAIDPLNHNHILAAFHSVQGAGQFLGNAPVIESLDGVSTWTIHALPNLGYTHYIFFMDNSETWLLGTQGKDFWRTTDTGKTWKQVSNSNITDGGTSLYRTKTNTWYTASEDGVLRSLDGVTWKKMNSPQPVYSVIGDGTKLFTQQAFAGSNPSGPATFFVSDEETGTNGTPMNSQKFNDGPMSMVYDSANRYLYTSNWNAGVWKFQLDSKA